MLLSCRTARHSIDIEQYIFCPDTIGKEFLQVLKERAESGVKVRMLLDTVGSWALYKSAYPADLKKVGVEIRFFNPISPWRIHNFTSWVFRDHKKALIVDGETGFTGGSGIGDHMKSWRDTNVKVVGPAVREIADAFQEIWDGSVAQTLPQRIKRFKSNLPKRFFLTNSPFFKKRFLYYALIENLRYAKKSIKLANPYFIPDRRLMRVLRLAATRGVEVQILVPKTCDIPVILTASQSTFETLLEDGVKIFQYEKEFHHAKTAVVDEDWATVGSFNLDNMSFLYNFEANLVSTEKEFVGPLTEQFEADLLHAEEVTLEAWRKRPWNKKIREFFVFLIKGFL